MSNLQSINNDWFSAVIKGNTNKVKRLISEGAEVNAVDEYNNTPLHYVATNGHAEIVKDLLNNGADVNAVGQDEKTPLHWAAAHGRKDAVDALLKVKGIDVNAQDKDGKTPLHRAAENSHAEIVKDLLDKGANVNAEDDKGETPLGLAANQDIQTLLQNAAELLEAAESGDIDEVKRLISEGASVNATDQDGKTPLHWAARDNNKKVVEGIDVNAKDQGGNTPLHWAAVKGHKEVVEALLGKDGIDVNLADKNKDTPLHSVLQKGNIDINVLNALLRKEGIDVNLADKNKDTPLHSVLQKNNIDINVLNALLRKEGIDVNAVDVHNNTPLHLAVKKDNIDINVLNALLGAEGINVNVKDEFGEWTPLHWAVSKNRIDKVKALLGAEGIDVNIEGKHGKKTPLHLAAQDNNQEIVEDLIRAGADVNKKDKNGDTPFDLATDDKIKTLLQPAEKSDDGLGGKSPESNEGNPGEDTGTQQKEKQEGNAKEETQTSTNSTVSIKEEGKNYDKSEYFSGSKILDHDYQDKLTNIFINSHCSLNGGERMQLAENIHQIRQIFSKYADNNIYSMWIGVFDIGKLDTDEFKEREIKSSKEKYWKNSIHVRSGDVQDKVLVYSWLDINQFNQDKWNNFLSQLEGDHKVDFIGTGPLTFKYKDFNYRVYPPLFGSSDGEQSSLSNTEVFSFSRTEVNQIIENIKRSHQSIKKQVIDHYASLNKDFVENDVDFVKIITDVNNKTKLTSIRYSNTSKDITLESEIKYETTPLHTLAKLGDELLSNVNDLLAGGADVNAMDKSEKTPLHYAAKNGHVKIVQVLLKADGINVNAVDEDGKTPFDLTTNEEIKALLQNAEKTDPVNESSTDSEGGQGKDAGASGEPSTPTQNHGGQTSTTSAEKGTDIKAEGVEAVAPIEPAQTEEQPSSFFGSLFSILMKPFSLIGSFLGGFFSWLFGSDEEKSDTQPYDDSSSPRVDQSVEQNNGDHNDQSNVI